MSRKPVLQLNSFALLCVIDLCPFSLLYILVAKALQRQTKRLVQRINSPSEEHWAKCERKERNKRSSVASWNHIRASYAFGGALPICLRRQLRLKQVFGWTMVSRSVWLHDPSSLTFLISPLCAHSKTLLQAMWYRVFPTSSRTPRSTSLSLTPVV